MRTPMTTRPLPQSSTLSERERALSSSFLSVHSWVMYVLVGVRSLEDGSVVTWGRALFAGIGVLAIFASFFSVD